MPQQASRSNGGDDGSGPGRDDTELKRRVADGFKTLAGAASRITRTTERIAETISRIEAAIDALGLEMPVWVRTGGDPTHEEGGAETGQWVGYARTGRGYGLVVRIADPRSGEAKPAEHPLAQAPRQEQIEAIDHIPALLDILTETAGATAARLEERHAFILQIADSVAPETQANRPPAARRARARR